jgi:hypothetical protein
MLDPQALVVRVRDGAERMAGRRLRLGVER